MPEQIWAISRFDTWNARGPDGYWSKDLTDSRHYEEYIRADIYYEATKSAAQADYERRILSALEDTWTL